MRSCLLHLHHHSGGNRGWTSVFCSTADLPPSLPCCVNRAGCVLLTPHFPGVWALCEIPLLAPVLPFPSGNRGPEPIRGKDDLLCNCHGFWELWSLMGHSAMQVKGGWESCGFITQYYLHNRERQFFSQETLKRSEEISAFTGGSWTTQIGARDSASRGPKGADPRVPVHYTRKYVVLLLVTEHSTHETCCWAGTVTERTHWRKCLQQGCTSEDQS